MAMPRRAAAGILRKMEPFKIKAVEPIFFTDRAWRAAALQKAHFNLFFLKARDVMIDLLTDSGTGAMSAGQWSALLNGDESYAGSESFFRFEKTVREITGMEHILPVHQGRAAERLLFDIIKPAGGHIISNTLFDTTRANAMSFGFKVMDIPCAELGDPAAPHDFKGNIDLNKLEHALKDKSAAAVIFTITNNSGGGQPASLENITEAGRLCRRRSVPLILDGCRFAENAYFIKQREKAFQRKTPKEIARMAFDQADMCFVSAKKDGLSNIGGFFCARNEAAAAAGKSLMVLSEGFPTYGGLAGRDLDAIAAGLREALEEPYLKHRISAAARLHRQLAEAGIPLIRPAGGHAVYIDAKALLPHVPVSAYPGQAFAAAFYEFSGVRSCEIGSVMMGRVSNSGEEIFHSQELVRLALPRRVYTQPHLDYVAESAAAFKKEEAERIKGVKITRQAPFLRHFTAHFERL